MKFVYIVDLIIWFINKKTQYINKMEDDNQGYKKRKLSNQNLKEKYPHDECKKSKINNYDLDIETIFEKLAIHEYKKVILVTIFKYKN